MPTYRTAFISHAHADNERCASIAAKLRARGVDVWIDVYNAQVAHNLGEAINQQLEQRMAFVLMVTTTSNRSHWVQMERDGYIALVNDDATRVVKGVERLIVPVRLNDQVPVFLRGKLWIDGQNVPDDAVADRIAAALVIPADRRDSQPPPTDNGWDNIPTPSSLARLGFQAKRVRATGVEFILPPTCDVPAGAFDMGSAESDTQAYVGEKPQYSIPVAAFAIGKYPVTVAEYACYLRANPSVNVPDGNNDDFYGWKQQQSRPDHPVVRVTWFNARDYTAWLAKTTGQPWRLPSEAQWEKAARWDEAKQHARIYPWGDTWDKTRANTRDGGPKRTTSVGSYPGGASPCGAQDMAGNVVEWTSSLYKPYPYNPTLTEPLGNGTDVLVFRGGSWLNDPGDARAAFRGAGGPFVSVVWRGFRLCRGAGAGMN